MSATLASMTTPTPEPSQNIRVTELESRILPKLRTALAEADASQVPPLTRELRASMAELAELKGTGQELGLDSLGGRGKRGKRAVNKGNNSGKRATRK